LKGYVLWTIRRGNGYRPTTTLNLEAFTYRNFIADFIRLKLNFILFGKAKNLFLSHTLGTYETRYAMRLYVVGNPVINFLFVIIELCSLSLTA